MSVQVGAISNHQISEGSKSNICVCTIVVLLCNELLLILVDTFIIISILAKYGAFLSFDN